MNNTKIIFSRRWPDKEDFTCPRRRALLQWCDDAADVFTVHGVAWFNRTSNMLLRKDNAER